MLQEHAEDNHVCVRELTGQPAPRRHEQREACSRLFFASTDGGSGYARSQSWRHDFRWQPAAGSLGSRHRYTNVVAVSKGDVISD